MPDNLYGLINEGILPDLKEITLEGNARFNNTAFFLTTLNLVVFDNGANVYFTNNADILIDSITLDITTPLSNIFIYGGSNGQVLTTDGTGNLSWSNGGGSGTSVEVGYNGNSVVATVAALNFRNTLVPTAVSGNIANINFIGLTTVPYGSYIYGINNPSANTVATPSNISSFGTNIKSANFDVTKYIIGSNVGANYIWPYVQNTSTTANGYLANSTAPFQPANASILNITNGTDNWYVLDYSDFTFNGNNITISDPISANGTYCFYANVDANIQLLNFATTNANSTEIIANTTNMAQYEIKANVPTFINIKTGGSLSNCDGTGFLIRNMTGGSNVVTMSGYIIVEQDIAPPATL